MVYSISTPEYIFIQIYKNKSTRKFFHWPASCGSATQLQ